MLRFVAGAALALLLATGPAFAQFGPQGPPAVGVMVAERRPVTEAIEFVGRVEATDRVNIRARVTGFLQERLFREGGDVNRGETLYRIGGWLCEREVWAEGSSVLERAASLPPGAAGDGAMAATALYRAAEIALTRLNRPDRAAVLLQRLLQEHPDSQWRTLAERSLRHLQPAGEGEGSTRRHGDTEEEGRPK